MSEKDKCHVISLKRRIYKATSKQTRKRITHIQGTMVVARGRGAGDGGKGDGIKKYKLLLLFHVRKQRPPEFNIIVGGGVWI